MPHKSLAISNNEFFKTSIRELNKEIKRALRHKQIPATQAIIYTTEARVIYESFRGKCAYCGANIRPAGGVGPYRLYFQFYVPLAKGGRIQPSNVVPCCALCKKQYQPRRRMKGEIPDITTFADLTERLFEAVIDSKPREVRQLIKREMNRILEEIAVNIPYAPFKDWIPENLEVIEEDVNTIPDKIEELAEGGNKEEITEGIKQLLTTKQYKVIRNAKDLDIGEKERLTKIRPKGERRG